MRRAVVTGATGGIGSAIARRLADDGFAVVVGYHSAVDRAEALVATAAALSVAIPATFGYNILASRLNRLDNLLEGFGTTVISMLVREGRV